jgi:DNA repair protein RecO (recombination protein O)
MLHKTRGIVLKTTDYSESSVIVQILTEKFGLQSYLINGVKKPKAKIRQNMLQPLHLLDMVVYYKPGGNIQRVAELRQAHILQNIPYDTVKSALALFLNEVLYKSIRHQDPDQTLFEYVFHSIELLDEITEGTENFHLFFLMRLTQFLGFYPDSLNSNAPFFDLKNGVYCNTKPTHLFVLEQPYKKYWSDLINSTFDQTDQIKIPGNDRRALLEYLLDYYRLHLDNFGEVKSHRILEEVLSA